MLARVGTFGSTLAALAAILAIVGALAQARHVWMDRRLKAQLDAELGRLLRLDRRLVGLIVEVDQALGRGVGWFGYRSAPPSLGGHMNYLYGLSHEFDSTTAALRAMSTSGPVERLRSDLEELTGLMRDAAEAYLKGIWATYRATQGAAVPYDVTVLGSPTVTLCNEDLEEALDRQRQVQLLFRTTLCRLHRDLVGGTYHNQWPTDLRPGPDEDTEDPWRGEPRPITGWPPLELRTRVLD